MGLCREIPRTLRLGRHPRLASAAPVGADVYSHDSVYLQPCKGGSRQPRVKPWALRLEPIAFFLQS